MMPAATKKRRTSSKKPTANQQIEEAAGVRTRKAKDARTLAVSVYARELEILEEAMKRQESLGSRATISSCLRWAINTVDFNEMPPIF